MNEIHNENNNNKINKDFIVIKMKRVKEGLKIYVKSEEIEDFFSTRAISGQFWNNELYNYPFAQIGSVAVLNRAGENDLIVENKANLSFLRIKGVRDGVEFTMPGVFSLDKINDFVIKAKEALKILYKQYLKAIEIEINITIKEVI